MESFIPVILSSEVIETVETTTEDPEILNQLYIIAESSKLLNNQIFILTVGIFAILMFMLFYKFLKKFI